MGDTSPRNRAGLPAVTPTMPIRAALRLGLVLALVAAGCAASSTAATPTPLAVPVTTPEAAVTRVINAEERLTGITPRNPDAIGQATWYEVAPASGVGAFVVTVRIGWGDCPAGCIDEHVWHYAVTPDGAVSVVSEEGGAVPDDAWPSPLGAGRTGIGGVVTAGPVCPVEKNPPDPACAPRPVVGAVLVFQDAAGTEVGRATTSADGTFFTELPQGFYVVVPQPAEGLMGTPGPESVTVTEGATVTLALAYDTGIR
jgi:hypothetical protein